MLTIAAYTVYTRLNWGKTCIFAVMYKTINTSAVTTWEAAFKNRTYITRLIAGLIVLAAILCTFTAFFQHIQQRKGVVLNDVVLKYIPAVNVSLLLLICIWATTLLVVTRFVKSPALLLNFLWVFILLSLFRMATLTFVALDPPEKLITIVDPLSTAFYGKNFITKDLFFSGHTATMIIMFFCLEKRADKIFALVTSLLVAVLVLVQHIHYTIDVAFAGPFAYLSYIAGIKITGLRKGAGGT